MMKKILLSIILVNIMLFFALIAIHEISHVIVGYCLGCEYEKAVLFDSNFNGPHTELICNNRINEIKGLDNLTNLEFLDLSYNQISEIKGLDNLKNLKFLDLRNNKISAIKQLNILKQLEHLYLGFNRISIKENTGNKSILDNLSNEERNISDSPFDFFYNYKSRKNSVDKNLMEISDIKYRTELFKSQSLLNELKLINNPINYFTSSSWLLIWKNNEFEIFRVSKAGKITWIQRRRKRKLSI